MLAIAVAKGRAGYVYSRGGELMDWGISVKASQSANQLVGWVQELINHLKPDVVISEKITALCRKGRRTNGVPDRATGPNRGAASVPVLHFFACVANAYELVRV